MYTLGINAAFHDSSACLVRDGDVIAAAEEERFTAVKHAKRPVPFSTYELPYHAIDYCLREAGIRLVDVDDVVYSLDPHLLGEADGSIALPYEPSRRAVPGSEPWEPLFRAYVLNAPRQLADGAPHHLKARFAGTQPEGGPYRWHFVDHHLAHAASAFLPSPFGRAAVLAMDGRGEVATTSYWRGDGASLERLGEVDLPHSVGLLYERVTEHLGFLRSSDEYKVMALASFGHPSFRAEFARLLRYTADGCYETSSVALESVLGPARRRGEPIEQRHYDIARSLQDALEDIVMQLVEWLYRTSGERDLCLAGGVALNCVLNARIAREGPFERVWVQPAAGDAGTALGAALSVDADARGERGPYRMDHAYLGPDYSDEEIEAFLRWAQVPHRRMRDVAEETAALLVSDQVVGWFQGRMEFGPRALGARSIVASPLSAGMQARLNEIKDREDFRPVAPSVIEEEAADWFECSGPSPFMLFVHPVRPERIERIPAVAHVDGTARIQTVNRAQHPLYYDLLRAFRRRTGVPVLVNTSFNVRGRPIVDSPQRALEAFWTTPLDALVMGPFLVTKHASAGVIAK